MIIVDGANGSMWTFHENAAPCLQFFPLFCKLVENAIVNFYEMAPHAQIRLQMTCTLCHRLTQMTVAVLLEFKIANKSQTTN